MRIFKNIVKLWGTGKPTWEMIPFTVLETKESNAKPHYSPNSCELFTSK